MPRAKAPAKAPKKSAPKKTRPPKRFGFIPTEPTFPPLPMSDAPADAIASHQIFVEDEPAEDY